MRNLQCISLFLALFLGCIAAPLSAEDDVARTARAAAKNQDLATAEMVVAKSAKNPIQALASTIRAFEDDQLDFLKRQYNKQTVSILVLEIVAHQTGKVIPRQLCFKTPTSAIFRIARSEFML